MTYSDHAFAFRDRWLGKYIDEDQEYGSQCWDVVGRYSREEYGCPSLPTVSGGAEGLFRLFADPLPEYFAKIVGDYQIGDIIVWSSDFYPPYGHTALCLGFDGTILTVMEQDGSNDPNGDGNADGVSYIAKRGLHNVAGALRWKGAMMSPTRRKLAPMECVDRFKNFAGRDDITPSDPVCQNRFEDPESDEFLYGLLIHTRDLRIGEKARADKAEARVKELEKQISDLGYEPVGQLFVLKAKK